MQDKNGLTDSWAQSAAERKLWLDDGVNDQEIIRFIPAENEPHITEAAGGAIEDQHDRWREMDVIEPTLVVPNGQGPVGVHGVSLASLPWSTLCSSSAPSRGFCSVALPYRPEDCP